jgi:hypothetical protein
MNHNAIVLEKHLRPEQSSRRGHLSLMYKQGNQRICTSAQVKMNMFKTRCKPFYLAKTIGGLS